MIGKLLPAACAAACSAMAAAATVELYGAIDFYLAYNHEGGNDAVRLQSGGLTASHWGLRGSEDLGHGWKVVFKLENGFTADNGAISQGLTSEIWEREGWLGIDGPYGKLSFGRQYTPHFLTSAMTDPTWLSLGSSWSGFYYPFGLYSSTCVTGGDNPGDPSSSLSRQDNSILYVSPRLAGAQIMAYVSLGEREDEDGPSSDIANNYNLAVNYANGPLFIMGSFLWQDQKNGIKALNGGVAPHRRSVFYNLGVTYDLGFTKPALNFVRKIASDIVEHPDFWVLQIGTTTPLAGGQWAISASLLKNESERDADAWAFGTKYRYPLSKRTTVYFGVEAIWNDRNAIYAVEAGTDSSPHFPTSEAGNDPVQVFCGVNHRF